MSQNPFLHIDVTQFELFLSSDMFLLIFETFYTFTIHVCVLICTNRLHLVAESENEQGRQQLIKITWKTSSNTCSR